MTASEERSIDPERLRRWYDFQAPFYSFWRDDYDGPLVLRVEALLRAQGPALEILDAGCGTGLFAIGLGRRNRGWRVAGVDAAAGMIAVGRRKVERLGLDNVRLSQGDVTALPWPAGSLDAIVAGGLFPNLPRPGPALAEFRRVLRPGGRLIVAEVDRQAVRGPFRLFFQAMILGYRAVAAVFPRFRFARSWSVERSTVDADAFERELRGGGFQIAALERVQRHLIYDTTLAGD